MAGRSPGLKLIPWRYGLFLLLCLSIFGFAMWLPWYQAAMAGFDIAAIGYFATLPPLFKLDAEGIRKQAEPLDADRILLLVLTAVTAATIMAAIATELGQGAAPSRYAVILIIATLFIAWCFSNMVYAMHYAHLYYDRDHSGRDRGGIDFPADKHPDYWDFAYFSYTLGMTFQTSDIDMTSKQWRRIALFQSIAAFIFNLGILAFSINILAG